MELLKLLLFSFAFTQLSYWQFFNFCLLNEFIKYIYYINPLYTTSYTILNITTFEFILTFIHLVLHMLVYYIFNFIQFCQTYKPINFIICKYNWLNKQYLQYRGRLFHYGLFKPFEYLNKKIINWKQQTNLQNKDKSNKLNKLNEFKPIESPKLPELKTKEQINNFLDKIMPVN